MAFHYSRRKLKVREEEEMGELNIVPYLDILMNLIIFMLLSITGLTSFGILNVTVPNSGGPTTGVAQDTPEEKKLTLSVLISKKGHFVSSEHTVLGESAGTPTIPTLGDGSYDFKALTAKMVEVKSAVPEETKVVIAADPDIPYEALIQTMDAIRETSTRQLLFPDVTLGAI